MQRNIFQRGKTFGITEIDVFVANVARDPHRRVIFLPTGLDRLVQNFKHALARGPTGLDELVQLVQAADRIIKKRRKH